MHIELAPKYGPGLLSLIAQLNLEAHLINSFNASGETITLSAGKDELERILEATEEDFKPLANQPENQFPPVTLEGLKAILKEQLSDHA